MARLRFPGRPGQRFGRLAAKYSQDQQIWPTLLVAENVNVRLKTFSDIFGDSDEDEDFQGFTRSDIRQAQTFCNQVMEEKSEEPRRGKRTVAKRSYADMIRHGFSPSEKRESKETPHVTVEKEKNEENWDNASSNDNTNSSNELCPIGKLKIRMDRGGKKARIISNSNASADSSNSEHESVSKRTKKAETTVQEEPANRNARSTRRKAFVLPARSVRSSRLIIPRKRLMEEFDCSALTYQVSRKPVEESSRAETGKVTKKNEATPEARDGERRPSLKVKLKDLSESNSANETREKEGDDGGNLIKRIELDISKYADTMVRKRCGKMKNKWPNSPVWNNAGVEATSSGGSSKLEDEVAHDPRSAKIEKMLRAQWDGRLMKPNGKRSSDEEIAASKQRASTQRRTKSILRKARLQLNKRTLMKLRQPASVRKLSEQFLKDQSEVHASVKLNRFPTVTLEPMDAILKQTKSLGCGVCGQTSNFCLVNEFCGHMCCEYCLKFYRSARQSNEELVCENKVNVGLCNLKPNVLGQLVNCKYCWFQKCSEKFKSIESSQESSVVTNDTEENVELLQLPKRNGIADVKLVEKCASSVVVVRRRRGRPRIKVEESRENQVVSDRISAPSEGGPRIKHVCRRASVVLGFQRATFPTSNTIGMAHKALKKAKRIKANAAVGRVSRVRRKKEEMKVEVDENDLDDNDLDDEDYSESKKQTYRSVSSKRKVRCKTCAACTRQDCGKCIFCIDMRKFGGRQVLKQCCMHRKCINPLYKTGKSANRSLRVGRSERSGVAESSKSTGKEFEGSHVLSSSSKKAGLPTCGVSAAEMMDGDELWPLTTAGSEERAKGRKAHFAHTVFVPRPVKQKEKERPSAQRSVAVEVFNGASIRAKQNLLLQNGSNVVLNGSKTKELVNVDYWEDYDPDEIWNCGRALIASHLFPIRVVCFLCGSGGQYEMIYCILCCEAFHRFCLEAEDVPLPENVENWCCRKCQMCNCCGAKDNLLKCFKCQNTYHAKCLGSNYPAKLSKKKKIWICIKCVKCKSCGSTSPGNSTGAQWMFDFSLCYDCGRLTEKGNYCPLCQKCYEDDDYDSKMVQCMQCESWIHAKCDEMTDEMYQILSYLPESVVYTCRKCTPERPPSWLVSVEAELQAGLLLVLSVVASAKCSKHLIRRELKDKTRLDYSSSCSSSTTASPIKSAKLQKSAVDDDDCAESASGKKNVLESLQEDNLSDLMGVDLNDYLPSTDLFTDFSLDKNSTPEIADINLDSAQNIFGKSFVPEFDMSMGFSSGESSLEKSQKDLTIEVGNCISLIESDDVMSSLEKVNADTTLAEAIGGCSPIVLNGHVDGECRNQVSETELVDELFRPPSNREISFEFKDGQPRDFQAVKENIEKRHYNTVGLFCEDVIGIIRSSSSFGKKGSARAMKTIFIRQMEKIFPWFAVTSPSLWGQHDISRRLLPEAVVPPSLDHNYAQYLDVELDDFDQPSLFTVSSPRSVMDEFGDSRWCVLCSEVGDGEPDEVGRLLYCGQDDWIHLNCAVWSAEVFQEVDGSLQNVHAAITRGRVMKCERCTLSGATVGCCLSGCRANYHFMCARKANAVFQEDKKVYCSTHRSKSDQEIGTNDFTVSHSVYIDLESLYPKWAKKTWQKGLLPVSISILAGSLMVEQLGSLSALSDTLDALIPINFQCTRVYWSTTNPRRRVVYTLKTIEVVRKRHEEIETIAHVTTVHEEEVIKVDLPVNEENETNREKEIDKMIRVEEIVVLDEKKEVSVDGNGKEKETNEEEKETKTLPQVKSDIVDFLHDVLTRVDEDSRTKMVEVRAEEVTKREDLVEELKKNGRKTPSNGYQKMNLCAESVVLLTPLCKKKLTGLKLTDSCKRAIGKKLRNNWGLGPLKKYPVRSTRYRAELVEPVVNGRKFKLKTEPKGCAVEERVTTRLRHLPGRRCWKPKEGPANGVAVKQKRYNFRTNERSKENQFANAESAAKEKCEPEDDADAEEKKCEPSRTVEAECGVVVAHRNAMQLQKSCSVKLKRIPSILRVRKVTLNGLGAAEDESMGGLEDASIRSDVLVTVDGKNGTSCCVARAASLERIKRVCVLNQDDNHNIVEPVEVADKKEDDRPCPASNGFGGLENNAHHAAPVTRAERCNNARSADGNDATPRANHDSGRRVDADARSEETGPFKCAKCKCLYRTVESCQRHMATCNFEVETTSSEDESLSPTPGKRKLPSDEETNCRNARKLFDDNEAEKAEVARELVVQVPAGESPGPAARVAAQVTQRRLLLPKPQELAPPEPVPAPTYAQVYQVPMGTPVVFSMNEMNAVTPLETVMEPLRVTYVGSVNVNQGQMSSVPLGLPGVVSLPSYTDFYNNLLQPCIAQNSWDASPVQLHVVTNQAVAQTPTVNQLIDPNNVIATQYAPVTYSMNNYQQMRTAQPQQSVVQVANEQLASLLSRAIVDASNKRSAAPAVTPVTVAKKKTKAASAAAPGGQSFARRLQNIAPKTEWGSRCTATSSNVLSVAQGSCEEVCGASPLLALYEQGERSKAPSALRQQQQQQAQQAHIVYQISSEDGFFIQTNNVNEAWRTVAERVQDARAAAKLKYVPVDGLNGVNMSGLGQNAVQYILEQMPQAKTCQKYRFRFHEQEIVEEIPENPSGCARSESFRTRKEYDMFNFLASKHRQPPEGRNGPEEEEMQHKSSRRATSMDLPMAMRFRHLRQTAREAVGVYRSKIHGRGLFCKRCIDVGEMVIEYAGEVIRSVLTDMREKYYESKGIGCYMFRIDDNEVVDATMHGNAARFINHSCEPNCYSKVITVDGKKHIIIFALRRINRGEELTYDYKFPIEDVKILCSCGSRRCRKYLN